MNNLSSSENNTFTKLTSTIYNNKTKIVFRIHTTSNLTRHKNTSIETKIVREETIKLPVEGTIITEKVMSRITFSFNIQIIISQYLG